MTPREQENELREKIETLLWNAGVWEDIPHDHLVKLTSLIKQDREAYATQVKKKAELALVVDLEAKTADGEWLSIWIKNQYKRLVAHSQQESIYKKNADNFRRER